MRAARAAFLLLIALALARPLRAGAGKTGFEFLAEPPGARSAAMGGTAVSAADDAEASLFNPAALGGLRQKQISAGYSSLMNGLSQASLVYGHPLDQSAFAFAVKTQSSGEISSFDGTDNRTGTYDTKDLLLSVGYGRAAGDWRWGVNLKQASESIAGHAGRASAADLGAVYRRASWPVSLSAALRNAGGKASLGQEKTPLPRSLDAGAAVHLLQERLLVDAESRRAADGVTTFALGVEGWLYNVMALRAGWQDGDRAGDGLSLGFGVKLDELRVDYSFAGQGKSFSPAHRLSLSWRFGGAGERAYQQGLKLAQEGRNAEAVFKFKESLDADPRFRPAARALRAAVQELEKEAGPDEH